MISAKPGQHKRTSGLFFHLHTSINDHVFQPFLSLCKTSKNITYKWHEQTGSCGRYAETPGEIERDLQLRKMLMADPVYFAAAATAAWFLGLEIILFLKASRSTSPPPCTQASQNTILKVISSIHHNVRAMLLALEKVKKTHLRSEN